MHARATLRLAPLLTLAAALACNDLGPLPSQPDGDARVRFLHAAAGLGGVTLRWNGRDVASGITFGSLGTTATYVAVAGGQRQISVRTTSADDVLTGGLVTTAIDAPYTLALIRRGTDYDLAVLSDTNTTPAGKATLRFVHLAPSLANLDAYATPPGTDLADVDANAEVIQYGRTSDYVAVDPGTYRIRFTGGLVKTLRYDAGTITVAAGQVRTIVVLDPPTSGGAVGSVVLEDR